MNPYNTTYPFLWEFEEKHGTRHFLIRTIPELFEQALIVLTERLADGYFYTNEQVPDASEYFVKRVGLTEEVYNSLPEPAQKALAEKAKGAKQDIKYYEEENRFYNATVKAVAEKDGKAAYYLLWERANSEYEGFKTEGFENVKGERPPEYEQWKKERDEEKARRKAAEQGK